MNIKQTLRKKLLNEAAGHDYGCVMLYLPIDKKWWDEITGKIKEEDVYNPEGERNYGVQPHDESHVTVLYGLHSDIPDSDIEEAIDKMTAPEVTLKKITMFDNKDKGFDVVKFDVEGEQLFDMNKMFAKMPHTTDYPDYHPHCTVAYVEAGTGKDYTRTLSDDEAVTIKPNKVVYSKASGEKKEYTLK
jgi:2'-5' RNA ligase